MRPSGSTRRAAAAGPRSAAVVAAPLAAKREWAWQREADGTGATQGVPGEENVGSSTLHPNWARTVDENGQMVECPIGCACAREGGAPEPTEDEYVNAVAEATQALEGACSQINDAVEELRYELEDADEE